MLQQLESIYFD